MSGPKISVYTLKGRTREIFLEQTNCLRQSHICVENIKALLGEINTLQGSLDNIRSRMRFIVGQTGKGGELLAELNRQEQQAARTATKMPARMRWTIPTAVTQRDLTESALAKREGIRVSLQEMEQEANTCAAAFQSAVGACREHSRAYTDRLYHALAAGFDADEKEPGHSSDNANPFRGIDFSVTVPALGSPKEDVKDMERLSFEISRQLREARGEPHLSDEHKAELDAADKRLEGIRDCQRLKDFHAITVRPLLKRCNEGLRLHRKQLAEYRQLRSRYLALCGLLQEDAADIPFHDSALQQLRELVAALEKRLVMEKEQEYISACVDDVMTEMGYALIGNRNVAKRNGKRLRNEIYTFSEGTAVNITYASDGQIAMELGGLDHTDRIPTYEESEQLCSEMEDFCGDFAEIEKRLAKKDVCLQDRISLSPPAPEYAAILNLDDYTVTTDKAVQGFSPAARKRGVNRQKTMRRDDV